MMFQNYYGQALVGGAVSPLVNTSKQTSKESPVEWTWDVKIGNDFVDILNNHRDVKFHRIRSSGTAVVRGSQPMSQGQHFWEIEMISPVYGTDMMVGIGTSEADMSQLQNAFISRLGKDNHTWGFSYSGSFYHNGEESVISSAFDQGSVIGLHLDLWNGTLTLYKNHKYLGVASKGLKGKTLYAMASSTAACSKMRLLQSRSFPSSLQFLCCAKLRDLIPDDKCVLNELDIPPGLKLFLKNNLSWLLSPRCKESHKQQKSKSECWNEPPQSPDLNYIMVGNRRIFNSFYVDDDPSDDESDWKHLLNQPSISKEADDDLSEDVSESTNQPSLLREAVESECMSDLSEDESECKRRRYSYNYAVGLSDPDSESDAY